MNSEQYHIKADEAEGWAICFGACALICAIVCAGLITYEAPAEAAGFGIGLVVSLWFALANIRVAVRNRNQAFAEERRFYAGFN